MSIRIVVVLVCVMASSTVLANAGRLSQIRQQQQEIRDETERATGRYVRFDKAELARLRDAQDKVFELLKGVTDPGQLSPAQQAELFNALETVKAVIARNDADRQVCWREKTLGSHRIQTHCATVAERAQIRQGARDWHGEPSPCVQSAGATVSCGRASE